ncbi:MAG: HDIG domain-containing protein [Candidatus Moraniibacteriota bacterium]|jgi:tRNA nucleotidyltransferase (CCA-adding enzyme)|nr:MAG: HDIG domain-containing protein [Candidatus Moranbacteria bacterium]
MFQKIPLPVQNILTTLKEAGFEGYVVGGSVRDLILERTPKDWDVTTNALPDEILALFPESFYENNFGTVGVKVPRFSVMDERASLSPETAPKEIIEVTTYRTESGYQDHRRPDAVSFTTSLTEDLARRDFTINALAYGQSADGQWSLVDPFDGVKDLEAKCIRTVGNPEERFGEDALRLMRAIRLLTELTPKEPGANETPWHIDPATFNAMVKLSELLTHISKERLRDELEKIILSPNPAFGIEKLHEANLLRSILPELELGIGVTQNLHHIYTVWEHNLRALATCPSSDLTVRLACLLHDVGKPATKRGEGYRSTFYNHDHVGARITEQVLTRLRFPKEVINKATLLVDNHLFYYNVDEVTEASVRRLVKRVGLENMADLMAVRIGDRLGSGVPKGKTYKLRHLEYMIDKVSRDPLSVKMLALKGTDLITELGLAPSPLIGALLDVLLSEVIDDPERNTRPYLLKRASELKDLDLTKLRAIAAERIVAEKRKEEKNIKKKHWVN